MSDLIPFRAPTPSTAPTAWSTREPGAEAPLTVLRAGGSASHARRAVRARRARRWDPDFHVDLLRF